MSVAKRKFLGEIGTLVDRIVMVITVNDKKYTGTLSGIDPESLTLSLSDAKDEKGTQTHKIFLNGSTVAQIFTIEKPFDLKALSERLEKVFPTMIKLYEDKGFIWVMEKIKVTDKGVVEGSGPIAERAQRVYDLFAKEAASK
ncbi:MAG: Lsm family RNA-binding protein [Candidatus Bathyarchaeia archaeon]|jgi:small nuclear ribonucleoprotein (snRNP)-like protein|nr:Lsm family RNA-binding protein [Candidatus Bathyarchaeum sp.]